MIRKWCSICLVLVGIFGTFSARADLKFGVMIYDPPLVMSATQGFHIDLAQKICQGLQEKCVIVPMIWAQQFGALDKGDIDLVMGVFPTVARAQKYIFSIPYMISYGRMIVLSKSGITGYGALKGLKVGTLLEETDSGGVFMDYIQGTFPGWFSVKGFKDVQTLLAALADNDIQAGLLHATAVNYWVANSGGLFRALGPSFSLGSGYTLMALPSKQKLIDSINQQIRLLMTNGGLDAIYNTYFGTGTSASDSAGPASGFWISRLLTPRSVEIGYYG